MKLDQAQLNELLLQSLEHEMGGAKLYEAAVQCAADDDLKEEWEKYLAQTQTHVEVLLGVLTAFGIDKTAQSPGRTIVKKLGNALVAAVKEAQKAGNPASAQIVAAECIVLAETKDHLNWELLGQCVSGLKGDKKQSLSDAYEQVEDQEDEHLYHTKGWCRELWIDSLGMKAVLPPPEERKHVKTAIGAARAEQSRKRH